MGILRKAMVAAGLFAALPTPPQGAPLDPAAQAPGPGTLAYVAAASDTFADVGSFCQRRPMACEVGQYLMATAEAKAKYSAKMIYEWANVQDHSAVRLLPPQDLATQAVPLPIERPADLMANRTLHKKS